MMAFELARGATWTPLLSPGGTRTHNLQLGMPVLYPVELRMVSGCKMMKFNRGVKGI